MPYIAKSRLNLNSPTPPEDVHLCDRILPHLALKPNTPAALQPWYMCFQTGVNRCMALNTLATLRTNMFAQVPTSADQHRPMLADIKHLHVLASPLVVLCGVNWTRRTNYWQHNHAMLTMHSPSRVCATWTVERAHPGAEDKRWTNKSQEEHQRGKGQCLGRTCSSTASSNRIRSFECFSSRKQLGWLFLLAD